MIFERVIKNLTDGVGRRGDDLGNNMATILPSWPWTWWENMKPSSILSVPFRKCTCTKCCIFCVLLPWCPLWHKPDQGKYNMPMVICPSHLWSMEKFPQLICSLLWWPAGTFPCTPPSLHKDSGFPAIIIIGVWAWRLRVRHRSVGYGTDH